MNFSEVPEFQKDAKALSKKVRSLQSDLKLAFTYIKPLYRISDDVEVITYRNLFFEGRQATILHQTNTHEVVKMRLGTDTVSMRGKLRLIFVAAKDGSSVTLLEVYAKNQKSREDAGRIKKYCPPEESLILL